MKLKELTESQIKEVFAYAHLNIKGEVKKLQVGFSNDVYAVGDAYILKSGKSLEDEVYLKKEVYICNLLKEKIPAPIVLHSDTSKKLIDRTYIIYKTIPGDNLYMKWHEYSTRQRKGIIKQICSFLRAINETSYEEYTKEFGINIHEGWKKRMISKIEADMCRVAAQGSLEPEMLQKIEVFVRTHASVLDKNVMALTYFDAHFDNFIVQDDRVVGMLDFERTDILSIDYVLDLVQRMVNYPKKYASEAAEALINPDDYKELMSWYEEYYPEIFQFPHLETRLKLYGIQYNLKQRYYWPNTEGLKEELMKNIE